MTIHARRHSPRVRLNETAYINFGSGRGTILDVSEGGLQFTTPSRFQFQQSESVKFRFTRGHGSEVLADLVWTDESRTAGGLRFQSVPREMRDQIRAWIDQPRESAESHFFDRPVATVIEKESHAPVSPDPVAKHESKPILVRETQGVAQTKPESEVKKLNSFEVALGATPGRKRNYHPMFALENTPIEKYKPMPRGSSGKHRLAMAALVILFLLGAATAAAAYFYPNQAHEAMTRAQALVARFVIAARNQSMSNVGPAAMDGGGLKEPGFTSGPFESAGISPDITGSTPASGSANHQVGGKENKDIAKSGVPASETTEMKNDADLAQARSYLSDGSSSDQKAKAVQLLWLATEKGNVEAELQLADLYTRGIGVAKSCVQARILLKAAAAVRPAPAQQKLAELDRSVCD